MSEDRAIISPKGVERLRAGHLWIYRSDVVECQAAPGSIVGAYDKKGHCVGKAFFSDRSQICLRFLSREDAPIDREFLKNKLLRAAELRQRVAKESAVYRLVHAEADGLPSVIVDRYGDFLCLQTLTQGADRLKPLLVELLVELFQPAGIVERNDGKVRELEGLNLTTSVLHGEVPAEVLVLENGLRFHYQLMEGQKTGGFLDQRENHARAAEYAFGHALDCFCYEGGFAVHIARQCETVEALDLSETAVQKAIANAALNDIQNLSCEVDNAFDRLRLFDNLKKKFDTIILDPPAFAKNRNHLEAAYRGYKEINLRAFRLLNPGGILITCSCSQLIHEDAFLNLLAEAATNARRTVQVIEKRTQSRDHPILLTMPETYYLKCIILRVTS
ncbi:MAG: class I SAM-dependent rRNA methyltransferase [Terriglobia bacterium]